MHVILIRPHTILTQMPGKAEITHFDDAVLGEQNILGFDVPVDAVVHVAVVDCLQNLPYDAHGQRQGNAAKSCI